MKPVIQQIGRASDLLVIVICFQSPCLSTLITNTTENMAL